MFRWREQQTRRHGKPILHLLFLILRIQVIDVSAQILTKVERLFSARICRFALVSTKFNQPLGRQTLSDLDFYFLFCSNILRTKSNTPVDTNELDLESLTVMERHGLIQVWVQVA